jgi:hypothetical protein
MSSDNNTANSEFPKTYRGPTKLVWEDGQQVMRPDPEAISQGRPGLLQQSYSIGNKTLDDIISSSDIEQFENLTYDEEKYQFISNMITGEGSNSPNQLFSSCYVKGDPRSLIQMLEDLLSQRKIYLDPSSGNLYSYEFAIKEHMISFPCRNCSKVLFSEQERTRHAFSHMQQQSE